ncbi:AIPR family protein [Nisaea denitrificans]|uniref:AIPR family protein n=1 Tax=Nisaea denitrificans TaxID=390877 RepID=UPI0004115B60|nr:AIPR family protein [Nisaea denitrificans]
MSFLDALKTRQALIEKIGYNEAYLCLAIALYIEEPDVDQLASIGLTEGSNDKKIDFIYHDRNSKSLVFSQGYMAKNTNDEAPSNKASDLNTACAWLISGDTDYVPEKLRGIISDFRESIKNGDIEHIDLLYVHNLPESINVTRELQTVESHLRSTLSNDSITIRSQELGKTKIEHLFTAQDSHIEVTDSIEFPGEIGIHQNGDNWSAGVATVAGNWLHQLYEKYGDKLYSANYRGFLGSDGRRRVNHGIRETAEKEPGNFWAYNNGITILTLSIGKNSNGKRILKGISIINGAQTSGSIGSIDTKKIQLDNVNILCRVIECSDQLTIDKIVRFNNTQNIITTWDRFSNDPDQKRLSDEFQELGYAYNRKRGFNNQGDQIGIEQVLQPLLAFHGRPRDAVRGKNQLFLQKHLYGDAFENKKARHIIFVYSLARAIDNKRLELKEKSTTETLISIEKSQLNLLRNLNFKSFLIATISGSLEVIVGKYCDPITVSFKPNAIKGTVLTDLSTRWLPVVESILPLLTSIVDPDTFFKNLSSQDNYLAQVKLQLDAMMVATNQQEKCRDFSTIVAAT